MAKRLARSGSTRYAMYLAVLPSYRKNCIEDVRAELSKDIEIIVSDAHLDPTVKTGIPREYYRRAAMWRIFSGRIFVQFTISTAPIFSEAVIVDLNPRSITAWSVLVIRRLLAKRTLVWGHIHPQAGPDSWTGRFRVLMRKIAHGTISYTYEDRAKALQDLPGAPVWVAPNALYRKADMIPSSATPSSRTEVLYVGRFVPAKKLMLLLRGFAIAAVQVPEMRLNLVGGGQDEPAMILLANELGIMEKVSFQGWEDRVSTLRIAYESSFCSVSPGFAGLGLTQSLGFGVPMVVADSEQHSPEIELHRSGGVKWFASDSPASLADAILECWRNRELLPDLALSEYTRERYSSEAMAFGIISALRNEKPNLREFSKDPS
ncbi:glycosyltransferase [Pseudarthrobacter sp. NPDC058196]|uniref:glycosyltransferase n=1 Tax=Pseudarthrobacter sp. NPDC058196 TaxID=3346376 RepID=UPI0036D97DE0